jgi:hypothetical protein
MASINGYSVDNILTLTPIMFKADLYLNGKFIGLIAGYKNNHVTGVKFEKCIYEKTLEELLPTLNGRFGVIGKDLVNIKTFVNKIVSLYEHEKVYKEMITDEKKEFLVELFSTKQKEEVITFIVLNKQDFYINNPCLDNVDRNKVYEKFFEDGIDFDFLRFYTSTREFYVRLPTDEDIERENKRYRENEIKGKNYILDTEYKCPECDINIFVMRDEDTKDVADPISCPRCGRMVN